MRYVWIFGVAIGLLALTQNSLQVSSANSTSYIGAVAEYFPVKRGTNGTTIANANANNYVTIVKKAYEYDTDIIVFPESSITQGLFGSDTNRSLYPSYSSFIPHPNDTITPCGNTSTTVIEALQILSCAAKNYTMYIVANLYEKENCTGTNSTTRPCPSDGYFFYSTNVAFNRDGTIVARYRKYNLFGEPGLNKTATADISTFTTDFNVTFGQYISFDALFKEPALTLVRDHDITDILFSLHWFSALPFMTAVQMQSAWAYANNVNFLGSSFNTPSMGSGGSGIFAGTNGTLVSLWSENATNAVLIARIPKVVNGSRYTVSEGGNLPLTYTFNSTEIDTVPSSSTTSLAYLLQDNVAPYTTEILDPAAGTYNLTLCDRGLCCSFYSNTTYNSSVVTSSSDSYYRYRFTVFNGVRNYAGVTTGGVQICAIVSCTNSNQSSCGLRFGSTAHVVHPTTFNSIIISGNFSSENDTLQVPNSLVTDILPLNITNFSYASTVVNATHSTRVLTLNTAQDALMTFAIYGRNFTADGLPVTTAASSASYRIPIIFAIFLAAVAAINV